MMRIYLLAVLFFSVEGYSQEINKLKNVIPPSPNASSLGKYGEWPVSLYTGLPNVNIPLCELRQGSLNIPVSLSYHAAGNKVGDIASWIGLGWNLNGGGMISRSVRGLPDEASPEGFFNRRQLYTNQNDLCSTPTNTNSAKQHKVNSAKGISDSEQDSYSFNALGRSFSFIIKADGSIIPRPYNKIKITTNFTTNSSNSYWNAIFEDGTVLQFGGAGFVEISDNPRYDIGSTSFPTAWLLKSVKSANGDIINFTYNSVSVQQDSYFSESDYLKYNLGTVYAHNESCNSYIASGTTHSFHAEVQQVTMLQLATIESSSTKIEFEAETSERQDLKGGRALSKIKVYSKTSGSYTELIKFKNSYSQAVSSNEYWGGVSSADETYYKKRLKLDSIEKQSPTEVLHQKWKFNYNTVGLPSRRSFAQDHWGFYNGRVNSNTLLPKFFYPLPSGTLQNYSNAGFNPDYYNEGANREGDATYAKAGILESIDYPTGGKTSFTFEGNTILVNEEVFNKTNTSLAELNLTATSNPFTVFQEQTFTITKAQNVYLNLESYISSDIFNDAPNTTVSVTVRKNSTQAIVGSITSEIGNSSFSGSSRFNILESGTYTLKISTNAQQASFGTNDAITGSAYLEYEQSQGFQNINKNTGGLRLNKMILYDGVDASKNVEQSFVYESPLIINPIDIGDLYFTETEEYTCENPNPGDAFVPPSYLSCHNKIITRNSSTKFSLGSVQGGTVGYGKVTTLYGVNGSNGKKITVFTNEQDQGLDMTIIYPYVPSDAREWRRGEILKDSVFNASNLLLSETVNTYQYENVTTLASFKAGVAIKHAENSICVAALCTDAYGDCDIQKVCYNITSETVKKNSTTQTTYSTASGTPLTVSTNYYYDNSNNPNPTRTETTDSKGLVTKVLMYSPLEKSSIHAITALSTEAATAIDTMVARNIISPIIQQVQYDNSNLTQLSLTNYKIWSNNLVLPSNVKQQVKSNTIDTRIEFISYDSSGNLLEQKKSNDGSQSYIWGYSNQYPIAQVNNATNSDIAYSSFESGEKGNWSYSGLPALAISLPTGIKYYSISSGNITKSGLQSGTTYIITYWRKDGTGTVTVNSASGTSLITRNGWTLYRHELTGTTSVTISGSGDIDELRLHPKDAQMVTYTYKPLVGISSQTAANNQTTYYEYDIFNRLATVKDQDRKIVKRICYNYWGQAENCNECVNTTADWQNTNEYSCQLNGSSQNTGYQLCKQIDMNPCSSTYGTSQWVVSSYNTTACPLPPQTIYAAIVYDNVQYYSYGVMADVKIKFYSDQACTTPVSVTNLSVNWVEFTNIYDYEYGPNNYSNYQTVTANGYQYVISNSMWLELYGPWADEYHTFEVLSGTGYLLP